METATVDFDILAGAGAPTCSYKAGDVIFREGDPARESYIVKSQLIDATSGAHIWADRFDRDLTDIFAVQDGRCISSEDS